MVMLQVVGVLLLKVLGTVHSLHPQVCFVVKEYLCAEMLRNNFVIKNS